MSTLPTNTDILRVQNLVGVQADGSPGDKTWVAIRAAFVANPSLWSALAGALGALAPKPAPTIAAGILTISQSALDLIFSSECVDQPSEVPPLSSGITIGYGDDLQYHDIASFTATWKYYMPAADIARLSVACGQGSQWARANAAQFADIHIDEPTARQQFMEQVLPVQGALTDSAFPGVTALPPAAQGALLSLVYNRGISMADNPSDPQHGRRLEMREIRDTVANIRAPMAARLSAIAGYIDAMCRLWVNQGADGLITRRHAEAALVRSAIPIVDNHSAS